MERSLVTIREITGISVHPNATNLELLQVDGWQVVAKIGDFKIGDKAVYFEIDSVLPEGDDRWAFLLKRSAKVFPNGVTGHRLKTIKLRDEFSQGLCLPTHLFSETELSADDIASTLGVFKYEPPVASVLAGNAKGSYPYWIPKTDQERIENCWKHVERMLSAHSTPMSPVSWIVEEKLEGSSVTIYTDNGCLGITSRNVDFKLDQDNTFISTAMAQKLDMITHIPGQWAIRGELVGPNIEGNIYKLSAPRIYIFDIWDGIKQRYLSHDDRMVFIRNLESLGAQCFCVPTVHHDFYLVSQAQAIKEATGRSMLAPTLREGIVLKTVDYVNNKVLSCKAISREYLAKQKD